MGFLSPFRFPNAMLSQVSLGPTYSPSPIYRRFRHPDQGDAEDEEAHEVHECDVAAPALVVDEGCKHRSDIV